MLNAIQQINESLQKRQVALYLGVVVLAGLLGLLQPRFSQSLDSGIDPALGLLLFATFLAIPLTKLVEALRNTRFLLAVMVLNFAIVPAVVWVLAQAVAQDQELQVGLLLVLLAPCVDYVIVFTRVAGGAHHQLLAATPVLMLLQMLLLPVYLTWFADGALNEILDPEPFVRAFIWLILIPFAAALAIQVCARRWPVISAAQALMDFLMVPLMMIVLFLVIASQVSAVSADLNRIMSVVPLYLFFLIIMFPVGRTTARIFKLEGSSTRALVFSGATRNSLVVLPLALAMPSTLALVPAVVVAQTIIELIGMLAYVKLVPRFIANQKSDAPTKSPRTTGE